MAVSVGRAGIRGQTTLPCWNSGEIGRNTLKLGGAAGRSADELKPFCLPGDGIRDFTVSL
jgi:hypothetical protein